MKRLSIILSILFLGVILKSCCKDQEICFLVSDLRVSNYSTMRDTLTNENDSVTLNHLIILFQGETYSDFCMNPFDGGSDLHALQCPEPKLRPLHQITNISITCDAAMNTELGAGAELKQEFIFGGLIFNCQNIGTNAEDCISTNEAFEELTIEEFFNEIVIEEFYNFEQFESDRSVAAIALPNLTNVIPGFKQFQLRFSLDDESEIMATTQRLFIH